MNPSPFSTRRKAPTKTLYARLFPHKKLHRQRAAAANSSGSVETEGSNLSRSLVIIFAIHIVAICMIFIHYQFFSQPTLPIVAAKAVTESRLTRSQLPKLSNGDRLYRVVDGDSYTNIANRFSVEEESLRMANEHNELRTGITLRIPEKPKIATPVRSEEPSQVLLEEPKIDESEAGLVDLLAPESAPKAQIISPNPSNLGAVKAITQTHTVKSGENLWRISNKYKVNQQTLMDINQIADPTKLKIGQVLKIPES